MDRPRVMLMRRERIAGITIAFCAVMSVFAVVHHPSVVAASPEKALSAMVRLAPLDRLVHGCLIGVTGPLLVAFVVFSMWRGIGRITSIAALVAYAFGSAAIVGAALIDGFIVPDIAETWAIDMHGTRSAVDLLGLCMIAIEVLSKVGLLAMAIAAVAWSLELIRHAGPARVAGIAALISAAGTAAEIAPGAPLTAHTLLPLILLQALWYAAFALLLVRASPRPRLSAP